MNKQEFLEQLRNDLTGLSQSDVEGRLAFYSEMIDACIEEEKRKVKQRRQMGAWGIALIVLGSPLWLPLLIAGGAALFSLYVSLWAVIISLWAVIVSLWSVFGALVVCAFGGLTGGIFLACTGHVPTGLVFVSAGIVCSGLLIFAFYGCKVATKGIFLLSKTVVIWTPKCFMKKEEAR